MKNKFSSFDLQIMAQALQLARLVRNTSPNPPVGAVLVKNKKIIATGYHQGPGKAHAEIDALKKAGDKARGATLYVTLEPCCHVGKRTPPCVHEIIKNKIAKVIIGTFDPNPQVNGEGVKILRKNKILVETSCLEQECQELIRAYQKWIVTKSPYIILKSAISLDGKIATAKGDSKWITGEDSRKKVHELRSKVDAILVGSNTALHDNPRLTMRGMEGKNPVRIVLDSTLKLSSDLNLFKNLKKYPTIVATLSKESLNPRVKKMQKKGIEFIFCRANSSKRIDLSDLFSQLGKREITSLLIEGGGGVSSDLLRNQLIDEFWVFIAPLIIGRGGIELFNEFSIQQLRKAPKFQRIHSQPIGNDFLFFLYPATKNKIN